MSTHESLDLEAELAALDSIVERLTTALEQLLAENRALRQRHESLATERASLLAKSEQARGRVEAIIGRLKTLEHGS